jgi:integrase|tara:strand:+ start:4100 stop:5143 length:1044 start_codon:yes stop_codon:yes gene_type:complete
MPRPNPGPRLKFLPKRGKFYVVWSEFGVTRERSTGTGDSTEAQAFYADFLAERRRADRTGGPRDPAQFSISEALELYGLEKAPGTAAPERIGYAMDALIPFWTGAIDTITESTCRAYMRSRQRATGTVRRELTTLRAAVNYALREGRLTRAPHVWLPDAPDGKDRWLTEREAAKLLRAARSGRSDVRLYLPLFILIGLYTGARKGAILSLTWSQVDLERGRIDFRTPGEIRTGKRKGVVRIPRRLHTFLTLAKWRGSDIGPVVHINGKRVKDIKRAFEAAAGRAGFTDVTPHTLRHTCGTWMAQRGVPLFEIGGMLGHSDTRTTELYAHHHPDHQRGAADALDRRRA